MRGRGDARVILTILRPCTTGGTEGEEVSARGRRGQRSKAEVAEKWNNVEVDRTEGGGQVRRGGPRGTA